MDGTNEADISNEAEHGGAQPHSQHRWESPPHARESITLTPRWAEGSARYHHLRHAVNTSTGA